MFYFLSKLSLADWQIQSWQKSSYLYRLVGLLAPWHSSSWLLQWSEGIGALLISTVLIFTPFVSTSLAGLLLIAVAGYWGMTTLADNKKIAATPIHFLVALYWFIAVLAVAFSPVKKAAFDGLIKLTLYSLFFVLAARILRSSRFTNWITTTFLLVSLVISAYGVRQQFIGVEPLATWNDPTSVLAQETRVYSYLGNPNLLAGYLLAAIALSIAAVFIWQRWLPKILALTMVAVNLSCLYFTGCRGAWIGCLALIAVFLVLSRYWWESYLPRWAQMYLLQLVFGGIGAALLIAIFFVEPLQIRIFSIFAGREDSSNNYRINVWEAVQKMIADRPFLGIGPGNEAFNKRYPLYMKDKYSALSAYSIYLETMVETGFIGFTCFLWLLTTTFTQGVKQFFRLRDLENKQGFWLMAALAGMVGLLVHGFVDTVWYRPEINTLWWLLVAIVASHYQPLNMTESRADDIQIDRASPINH
jgi:putative inorganic carbon (hco3(-)) transporter